MKTKYGKLRCENCKGTGEVAGELEGQPIIDVCPECKGLGEIGKRN